MSASFSIDKVAHQAASRTAHEFPEAGAQLPAVRVQPTEPCCPHCNQPMPKGWGDRVIYVQGRPTPLSQAPRHYTEKGRCYVLSYTRGTYVCID